MKKLYSLPLSIVLYLSIIFFLNPCFADNDNRKLFPIERYSQNVDQWLNPSTPNYNKNLLSKAYQTERLNELTHTYFGTESQDNSVWSKDYINYILNYNKNLPEKLQAALNRFDNAKQSPRTQVFGMNYRAYPHQWFSQIQQNISLSDFRHPHYLEENRAIATQNFALRVIPTDDPAYFSTHIAGEGYPFDNIQSSAVYVGTPLYIIGTTRDKEWILVITPECIGWMKTTGIARVSEAFIHQWQQTAYHHLVNFKRSNVGVYNQLGQYQFSGYVGMIFPEVVQTKKTAIILIPIRQTDGMAKIEESTISSENIVILPWSATPAHFAEILDVLKGRQYGWGSLGFYNDCSAEMKAIFSLFAIFMPRNTQSQELAGYLVDISHLTAKERSQHLIKKAIPLLTLIHVKGHILLYVGTYKGKDGHLFPLSYQQVWSLYPKDKSSRSVIGQAVFLPLLTQYPEDVNLAPQLDNELFHLIYLNQFPEKRLKQHLSI